MAGHVTKSKFRLPLDLLAVQEDWRQRGYSYHEFRDPPGRVWRDFVHATNELVTVAEGKLEVEIDGAPFIAEPGDEVFIPKDAVHTVRNIGETETVWIFGYD